MQSPSTSLTPARPPCLLETRNLTRTFTVRQGIFRQVAGLLRAVDGVSLRIDAGETLGLVGESGCGKSTLGRMAAGLLPPSSGDILLDGVSMLHGVPHSEHRVQMIFQDPFSSLNPRLTVGYSVGEPLRSLGHDETNRKRLVVDMLELVGLSAEHAERYPHEFSGGQRQRLAIARALITAPPLVICDEPVSALDASVQAQVLNLLRDLQRRFGTSYLFISHDLGVVGHMSDRVAVMYLGSVVEEASVEQLFTTPAHPYTRLLMAARPRRSSAQDGDTATERAARREQGEQGEQAKPSAAATAVVSEPPSPLAPPSGCTFHPRCPHAMDICRNERPLLRPVSGPDQEGHNVSCFLHNPS